MKKCSVCGSVKTYSEFYSHPDTADGLLGKCKDCMKAAVKANREAKSEHYRQFDRHRNMKPHRVKARKRYAKTESGKKARAVANQNYYAHHSEKRAATVAVGNAVRDGRLIKWPCETCGVKKVEAHHDDYSKPLEVRWLCNKHHREIHNARK